MACKVKSVLAENGKPSVLYEDLLRVTGDQSRALELYTELSDVSFPAHQTDKNGEPTIRAIKNETNLLENYEIARIQKGPRALNQDNIKDDVIESVLFQLDEGIKELERLESSAQTEAERSTLREQIGELEKERGRIASQETAASVRKAANRQLEWANSLVDKDSVSINTVMEAIKLMDMWKPDNTLQFLSENEIKDDSSVYNKLFTDEIGGRPRAIQDKLVRKGMDLVTDLVNKYSINEDFEITKDEITDFKDIGVGKSWFYNISHVDNNLITHFHKTLVNAKRRQDNEVTDLKQKLEELEKNVNPEVLLREDENGNKTAELIGPFSKEYYNQRSEIKNNYFGAVRKSREQDPEQADDTIREAKKQMYSDLNDIEEVIDIRIISDELETDQTLEEYRQELVNKYGEEYAEYAIKKAQSLWEEYKERRQEYKEHLLAEVESNTHTTREDESDGEWVDRKMRKFQMNNSPALYIRDRQDPTSLEFPNSTGWEYTFSLPKADQDFFNERFENLNELEREMWEEISGAIQEGLSYLPPSVRRSMDNTFLPKVQKSTLEMLQDEGMLEAARFKMQDFMDSITSAEDQSLLEDTEEEIPNPFETVGGTPPIRFLDSEDMNSNEISKDPVKATQMFYAMALNYKNMTDVSAEAKMIHRIVSEANTVQNDGKISEGAPASLKEKIEDEMEFLIANNRTVDSEPSEISNFIDPENPTNSINLLRQKKQLENDRDQLKQDFDNNLQPDPANYNNFDSEDFDGELLSESEYNEKLNELDQKYKDLGGRSLIWSSVIDNTLLSWGQLKGMAFNAGASFRNLGFGFIANFIHAAGGRDFDDGDLMTALNIVFRDMSTSAVGSSSKLQSLVDRFGILFDTAEVRFGKDRDSGGKWKDPYVLQNRTEFLVQGLTMAANMVGTTVTDVEGNERNLWEAFDEKGRWKTDEFGENEEWQPSNQRDKGMKFDNFREQTIQLNNRLHGDYSKDSQQKVKKYWWGRLASMFRTWIPETFAYRFGGRRKDRHLGREVVGSYRGTAQALKDNPMGTTLAFLKSVAPGTGQDVEVENVDDTKKEAIARTGREMQVWLTLAAVVTALQPPEDDDRETGAARKMLVNNLLMLKQDVGIYFSPTRMHKLIENPLPATRAIIDFDRAMKSTREFLMDEDYQGDHPIFKWSQTMPVFKQMNTIRWQTERIIPE